MKFEHIVSEAVLIESLQQFLKNKYWIAYNDLVSCLNENDVYFFQSKHEAKHFLETNNDGFENFKVVYANSVLDLVNKLSYGESMDIRANNINQSLKTIVMNEQNFHYLKDNIKYLGFGENLEESLKNNLAQGLAEFSVSYRLQFNKKPFEAILHFRKSDASDVYFLNSYSASLQRSNGDTVAQHFYLNKGKGVTAKEAYNLLEGRSVFKELWNKEGQSYTAWMQIDFSKNDSNSNYEIRQFHSNYGYDLKEAVSKFAVAELNDAEKEKALMQSLQKGNMQSVTIATEVGVSKMFMEANPQFKTVNLYDAEMKRVQKEYLNQYLSTGATKDSTKKEEQSQKQDKLADQKKEVKNNVEMPGETHGRSKSKSVHL